MCRHFHEDFGLETRVARYHNVYGPHGTYDGGAKGAGDVCRKVIAAQLGGDKGIEVWGDGEAEPQLHLSTTVSLGRARSCRATSSSRSTSAATGW